MQREGNNSGKYLVGADILSPRFLVHNTRRFMSFHYRLESLLPFSMSHSTRLMDRGRPLVMAMHSDAHQSQLFRTECASRMRGVRIADAMAKAQLWLPMKSCA